MQAAKQNNMLICATSASVCKLQQHLVMFFKWLMVVNMTLHCPTSPLRWLRLWWEPSV